MIGESREAQYDPRELLLDECYAARARWERRDYALTARAMAETGIDAALEALREYDLAVAEFENTFGGGV